MANRTNIPGKDSFGSLLLDNMVVPPPINTNSVENFDAAQVAQDAAATHIIVHSRFPKLVDDFLAHKRARGSEYEKELYSSMTRDEQISRLIAKRPLVFMGSGDFTVLRDGTVVGGRSTDEWDNNGTKSQRLNRYLTLKDYLSYDEIMLGSLIGVSGSSYFINDGNRYNQGEPGKPGTYEDRGVIIGLVGARFERSARMDSIFCLADPNYHNSSRTQVSMHEDLQLIFQNFFGAKDEHRTSALNQDMYAARMRIAVDILLLEANERAKADGRPAHVYVVGLGLGVWQVDSKQAGLYVTAFIKALAELSLPDVGTIEFAYVNMPTGVKQDVVSAGESCGIKMLFSRRNPAEKLSNGELLVLSYAWDGNAFPGNEYWNGSLTGSGDPAAACMSTIGELHNPIVNPAFLERIKVLGAVTNERQ